MARERQERRDRVALDKAYDFYRRLVMDGSSNDLHLLANSLKTVCNALDASENGEMQLTLRLWRKIRQALFDKLLTSFPCYVVAIGPDGNAITSRQALPDDTLIELHPEGLKRDDDVFHLQLDELHGRTREMLDRAWQEHGPSMRREDFEREREENEGLQHGDGGGCQNGVCALRTPGFSSGSGFIPGDEVMAREASQGRARAYQDYWRLYWQSYCSPNARERQYLSRQMASLEAVWGNLHY